VVFLSGRRSRSGDALLPSRLAFHAPHDQLPARVDHALHPLSLPRSVRPDGPGAGAAPRALPRPDTWNTPTSFRVTWFKTYLESPYLFYVRHILGLKTVEMDEHEMGARAFGNLAHEVLEGLDSDDLRRCTDAEVIAEALEQRLQALAGLRFGPRPLPAVELQLDQLSWRLARFAERQARRAAEGWCVRHSEWEPKKPVELIVDGKPVTLIGRIDRIDVHADGRWAIFDYKTGENIREPQLEHRKRSGEWRDLQLPLYWLLAEELCRGTLPELGYARLGKDQASIDFTLVKGWSEETRTEALEAARTVVRKVRAGEFFEVGRPKLYAPVLSALCGQGLLVGAGAREDGEEEAAP
jgi:RecB family exonuclease